MIFLVLISAGVVGGLFYTRTTTLLVDHALEDIAVEISNAGSILQTHISAQQEDVLFLSNTPPIQGMLRAKKTDNYDRQEKSTYQQWVSRLQTIFMTILNSKRDYLKLRFIDKNGQELVVVGREGKRISVLGEAQLQNKAHRAYVSETLKLAAGAVYLSEINLNREHGEVSEPHLEVLRSATPIYDEANGEVAGLLVITYEVGHELRKIQNNIHGMGRQIYISNDQGDYLVHPDTRKTYGFDLRKRHRIQEDIPKLARLFLPESREKQVTLMPKRGGSGLVVNLTKIHFDAAHPQRYIAVTMTQDYASIVAHQSAVLDDIKLWALFLALGATGLAIILSIRITQPIKQMTQAVDDFAHQRSTAASLPVNLGDEIGVLARTFNTMTQQVEESQKNLRELNDNLEAQVIERTRSLQESETQQRTILEAIADAVITIDAEGLITSFNPAAEMVFAYSADEILGQNVATLMPKNERQQHMGYTKNSRLHASRIINQARDLIGVRKDGSLFPLELNVAPLRRQGRSGFVGVLRDITSRVEAENRLRETEERFAFAVDGAGDGVWDWNMSTNTMQFSELYSAMLGYGIDELPQDADFWIKSVHPDDRERVEQNLTDYLQGRLPKYSVELRLRCKDDSYKWILRRGTVVSCDVEGNPMRLIGIHSDITQRKESESEMIAARDEADEANRAKSEFLSSMSHELRTPMNAILGFSQLMTINKEQPLNETQRENVNEIYKAGRHLLELINEVLDLARIEAGRVELSIEAVELAEVINESLQLIMPLAKKRGIEISLIRNGEELLLEQLSQHNNAVRADHTRLKQVLLNLLSNAVKYNSDRGKLIIACEQVEDNQTRVSITDTGAGLTQQQQTQLFTPFERLGTEKTNIEGTGIGLVITKNLVELMGGRIGVDSKSGEGCTFWFELPNASEDTLLKATADTAKPVDQSAPGEPEYQHTVLYIEDNPTNLRLVAQLLGSRPNINMWSAHEPLLGLDLAMEHVPDLILLDINLPGMDGFDVLKHLRERGVTRHIPVIAVSANAMPGDIEKGLAAGFDAYVTKPIDIHALLKVVETKLSAIQKA